MTLLRVDDLCLSIGSLPILKSLRFQIEAGQVFGVVG